MSKELLKELIAKPGVLVLSKTTCPYCMRAKAALSGAGIPATVVELDSRADGRALQDAAAELSGQRTVPNIWANGQHIGGSSDLIPKIQDGSLQKLLGM